jgi:hypothetical protein
MPPGWKWIGWVSPVRLAICQTSVEPAAGVSVAGSSSARPKRPLTGWFVPNNWIRRPYPLKASLRVSCRTGTPGGRCSTPLWTATPGGTRKGARSGVRSVASVMRRGAFLPVAWTTLLADCAARLPGDARTRGRRQRESSKRA